MFEKYLDNRLITLLLLPFAIGSLSVLSFQPFNFTLINFFILPLFFYLIVYIKKNLKVPIEKNLSKKIYLFSGLHLDSDSFLVDFTG